MNDYAKDLTTCLTDAGFPGETISEAVRFCKAGQKEDLVRYLRFRRCDMIEKLHESQKQIDRLDYMVRRAEKEI